MTDFEHNKIQKLNRLFFAIVLISMLLVVFLLLVELLANDENAKWVLPAPAGTVQPLEIKNLQIVMLNDMQPAHQYISKFIATFSDFFWVIGLASLLKLSRQISKGNVLTNNAIKHLKNFGTALLIMSFVDALDIIVLVKFLEFTNYAKPSDFNLDLYLGELDFLFILVGALLIIIMAKILNHAVHLEEESKLTV